MRVPNVWRRSWKVCASSSFAALNALRKRRRSADVPTGLPVLGLANVWMEG